MQAPTLSIADPALAEALSFALVWAFDLSGVPETAAMPVYLAELTARAVAAGDSFLPPGRKDAVRGMLRRGSYKPSGRSKPSSEYLLSAALSGNFPLVNAPVDANNAASLEWGYPASVFDLAKTGTSLSIRLGGEGESYLFNRAGQEIDLRDLPVVCDSAGAPCGNPVKDSMATKVFSGAREVAAVIYAPASDASGDLPRCAERLRSLFLKECGAGTSGAVVFSAGRPMPIA